MKKITKTPSHQTCGLRDRQEFDVCKFEEQRITSPNDLEAWPIEIDQKRLGHSNRRVSCNTSPQGSIGQKTARMVGMGFRCWYHGTKSLDTRFYDTCSEQYMTYFGINHGLVLSTKLAHWVGAIDQSKQRSISILSMDQHGFSYDEAVAISMITAFQHAECPAMKACLFAITHASNTERPHLAAQEFAESLLDAGHVLPSEYISFPLAVMQSHHSSCAH